MAKRRSTKTIWVRIIAFGLVIIFLGGYVAQSTLDLLANREQKQEQTTHINVPFKAQGVVNIREGVPEGALLYTGNIEIADTDQKREQGLMLRDSLAFDQGMLFIFPQEQMQSFWMKNNRISLDIIYIDDDGKIVSIARDAKPYDTTPLPSEAPARYVLEIPGGACAEADINPGDHVTWVISQ